MLADISFYLWPILISFIAVVIFRFAEKIRDRDIPPEPPPQTGSQRLHELANQLMPHFEQSATPTELLELDDFHKGVRLFNNRAERFSVQDLLSYASGDNAILACMAVEALGKRPDGNVRDDLLPMLSTGSMWPAYFILRTLRERVPAEEPLVGDVLLGTESRWLHPLTQQFLREFVAARVEAGETPTFGDKLDGTSPEQVTYLRSMLEKIGEPTGPKLLEELQRWEHTRIDTSFLEAIGRLYRPGIESLPSIIEHEALRTAVVDLETALTGAWPRSLLLVGESGVGKTAIVRTLSARLQRDGWFVFEAGHHELLAGQSFMGQLEGRLQELVRNIGGKRRILWFIPDFHDLFWTGRHQFSQSNVMDFLLPQIEQGNILILGETQPAAFDRLVKLKPRCLTALDTRRVEPLPTEQTLDLARSWSRENTEAKAPALLPEATLQEAWHLTQQYLGDKAAPGNLLRLLELTHVRLVAAQPESPPAIQVDDLIVTLTRLTGLPATILDDRQDLNLDGLRLLFEQRVMGQTEAIECLVERVAMIKAGVTDPSRPQGVFLFAGPTGTGKTEIAKTLAEFLFGSPQRMIRLDMSELQTPESLNRLMGEAEPQHDGALVDRIRKEPFSVVLLDEFEKAHSNVFDLFLQVFDDGRLTDRKGNTADFRHAIIIMTSNLGGAIPSGASLGFSREGNGFRPEAVERIITQTFRREFLNRIDRIVVFKPLSKDTMRGILRKELEEVTRRRGLRSRAWAIEWDDEAFEFLLMKGFTADLGARPLRRAIERYFLSPLAVAIVQHQYPAGDQFLFVRAENDKLAVEFVDPDAPAEGGTLPDALEPPPGTAGPPQALQDIVLDHQGSPAELSSLQVHYERIRCCVEDEHWAQRKLDLMNQMGLPEFWHTAKRFQILGQAEYLDRIQYGLRNAGSLLERLSGSQPKPRESYPRHLVGRLAEQLYLLDSACSGVKQGWPSEAFVLIEVGKNPGISPARSNAFARRLGDMYRQWARKRRMQMQVIEESGGDGQRPYRLWLGISGFGAFTILRLEEGLHLWDFAEEEDNVRKRCRVRVRVIPQPAEPAGEGLEALRRQAVEALQASTAEKLSVVRRYHESPPLARDRVRGWRTGKLERVLEGDFDLFGHGPSS